MDITASNRALGFSGIPKTTGKNSRLLKVFGVFCILATTFAFLLTFSLSGGKAWRAPSAASVTEGASDLPESPFRLSPEKHIFRKSRTIHEIWNIAKEERRPDGVLKNIYLINGLFPGPVLEARSGDRLIITVNNHLDNGEGTSIHWHGLSMQNANNMDGVVGITQNPIMPGESFVYDFELETSQHGTFWYHAHDSVQRADGMYGGLVIHEPANVERAGDQRHSMNEYLIIAGDWYHRSGRDALESYMHPGSFGIEPVPDNILVNGRGSFNCSMIVPARPVDCVEGTLGLDTLRLEDSPSLLRVINAGSYAPFSISSVSSSLTLLAIDSHSVQSSRTKSTGVLPPGGRIDVIFTAEDTAVASDMAMELHLDTTGFKYPNPVLVDKMGLKVNNGGPYPRKNTNIVAIAPETAHVDLFTVISRMDMAHLPIRADETIVLYAITQKLAHLKNEPHGFINNTFWEYNRTSAPLIEMKGEERRTQAHFMPHIQHNATSPLWIDLVLNNLDEESHPFHLHGHSFYVLATYSSDYNWGSYNPFAGVEPPGGPYNLVNPARRDTVLVPRRGYVVLRFKADNPGVGCTHCVYQRTC